MRQIAACGAGLDGWGYAGRSRFGATLRRKRGIVAAVLGCSLAVAGCSQSPNIGLGGQTGLQGITDADLKPPQHIAPGARYQEVEIRTEIRRSGVSIAGAACEARSSAVSLDFKTPARVILPILEKGTPPLSIRCEHPRQGVATAVLRPGAAAKADSLFEEIFGAEKPKPGWYLKGYALQLMKRSTAGVAPPPPALAAAMELPEPTVKFPKPSLRRPYYPRPKPKRGG